VSREEIAAFFAHPVILLIIGALLSGLLFPIFTNRWQIHQKGIEIRVNLIGRMSQTIMGMVTMIDTIINKKPSEEWNKEELTKEYRKLRVDGAAIWAELESYFPNQEIGMKWSNLLEEIESFYRQALEISEAAKSAADTGKAKIESKKREFKDRKRNEFLHEKYVIMEHVLNKPMPRFSLLPGFVVRSRLYKKLEKRRLLDAGVTSDLRKESS
jgi:hypothetical protein